MEVPFSVEPRRLAVVGVPVEYIGELMCKTAKPSEWFHVSSGIPKDAAIVDVRYCNETRQLWFTFEHESFKLTRPGHAIVAAPDVYLTAIHGVICNPDTGILTVSEAFPGGVVVIPHLAPTHVVTG